MKKEDIKNIGILMLAAILFLLFFSIGTSPIYPEFYIDDSALFISTARSMISENELYINIFDHKGPIIFWIEILGQLINWGRNGIFFIQIIFFATTLILLYKTMKIIGEKKRYLIPIFISLGYLVLTIEEGNCGEELSLPLISVCYYLFFKWMKENDFKENVPVIITIIYGVIFGILSMMKLTIALGLVGIILGIIIVFLKERRYKELLKNAGIFILGVLGVFIPICIYFGIKGTLNEMLYSTFIHNFLYVKNATLNMNILTKIIYSVPVIIATIGGVLYRKKNKDISLVYIISNIFTILFLCIGRGSQHYFIITFPSVVLGIYMILECFELKLEKAEKILISFICVIAVFAFSFHKVCYSILVLSNLEDLKYTKLYEIMQEQPNKDNTVFLFCPFESYAYTDILPTYKYSFAQDNAIMSNKEIEEEIIADIENKNIYNIVVGTIFIEDEKFEKVSEALERNYIVVDSYEQKYIDIEENSWEISSFEIKVYQPKGSIEK